MDICVKYKPKYLSELEIEYPQIIKYLNSNNSFIVNGPKDCGKSTIVKLYLEYLNYDYLLINDFNISKENLIEKLKYKTYSVISYFNNKKYIIVIDNFDFFDLSIKDFIINDSKNFQYLIITYKFLNSKINYIRINFYSNDYILNLYCIIYFLENKTNCNILPEFRNISQMFSILKLNLSNSNNSSIIFDKFDYKYNDLIIEKKFEKKLYILDKINSYNILQNNLLYNYKSIDKLVNVYDCLCDSTIFLNNNNNFNIEFYSILSMIGTTNSLDCLTIYKENFQIRKKKNLNFVN